MQMKYFRRLMALGLLFFTGSCATTKPLSAATENVKSNQVLAEARNYLGTPYKWGGLTKQGMDCSGLTTVAFKTVGLALARTADAQALQGVEVRKQTDLVPGDLLFFATGKKTNEITHVGIVSKVGSNGEVTFIHASTSKGVIESGLSADYWAKAYRTARRVLK